MLCTQSKVGRTKSEIINYHKSKGVNFKAEDSSASIMYIIDSTRGVKFIYIYMFDANHVCKVTNAAYPVSYLDAVIKAMDKVYTRKDDVTWIDLENNIKYILDQVAQKDQGYFQVMSRRIN